MTGQNEICCSGIAKTFSGISLFDDLDISLRGGSATILTGDNGTGKSTLLRIIAGLEKPDAGRFDLGYGFESWKQVRKRLIAKVMYLHQHPYMFEGSVYKNIALALPKSLNAQQISDRVNQALEWSQLTKHRDAQAKTLSGGQQQRVALARAWLRQSPFLLLDEPVANMDTQASSRTLKLLHELKSANISILISSHIHQIFDSLVDQHLELTEKKLVDVHKIRYQGNITPINKEKSSDNAVG